MRRVLGLIGLATALTLLAGTPVAQAKSKLFWSNFGSSGQIYSLNLNGGGGEEFSPAGAPIEDPAGLTADMKRDRLYWTDHDTDAIYYAKFNGEQWGTFDTGVAAISNPTGLQYDRKAKRIYWSNFGMDTIAWRNTENAGFGAISTVGATASLVAGIAIDPRANRIYWVNFDTPGSVGVANLDGSGGGFDLNLAGAGALSRAAGIALDFGEGRAYVGNNNGGAGGLIGYASTDNSGGGGDLNLTGATSPYYPHGVAIDPDKDRLYWVNSGSTSPIGRAELDGSGAEDLDASGQTSSDGAFPIILKKPRIERRPKVKSKGAKLRCKRRRVALDLPATHLYRSARKITVRWRRNGKALRGKKGATLKPKAGGKYQCQVIAKNYFGKHKRKSKPKNA